MTKPGWLVLCWRDLGLPCHLGSCCFGDLDCTNLNNTCPAKKNVLHLCKLPHSPWHSHSRVPPTAQSTPGPGGVDPKETTVSFPSKEPEV